MAGIDSLIICSSAGRTTSKVELCCHTRDISELVAFAMGEVSIIEYGEMVEGAEMIVVAAPPAGL